MTFYNIISIFRPFFLYKRKIIESLYIDGYRYVFHLACNLFYVKTEYLVLCDVVVSVD